MPIRLVVAKSLSEDPVLRAAEGLEPVLRKAFLDAVARLRSRVALERLIAHLQAGDVNAAMAYLATDSAFAAILQQGSFRSTLERAFVAGSSAGADALGSAAIRTAFDLQNPEAVSFIERYAFKLIKQISEETRDAIKQTVLRAFKEGGAPAKQAREIRENLGLTVKQEQAVANYRTALENQEYANALGRALRDGRFDRTLLRAQANRSSLRAAQIDTLVDRYRQRFINYRATNIARTESLRASNRGQQELWRQAKKKKLLPEGVRQVWIISGDERTCSVCGALNGQTAALGEEFAPDIFAPPDPHPSCRCSLAIDKESLQRFDPKQWEAA